MNWTLFDYSEPLCCFFTGCHGDKLWSRDAKEYIDPFSTPSIAELGIGEFRLIKGIFHCPIPHWGIRHLKEIRSICHLEEMRPWTLGIKDYDRPIARRIIEEAGVPRGIFAKRKKNTAHESNFRWPYSSYARISFRDYLKERKHFSPPNWMIHSIQRIATIDSLIYKNVIKPWGLAKGSRPWNVIMGPSLLFQWANEELTKQYVQGLDDFKFKMCASSDTICS